MPFAGNRIQINPRSAHMSKAISKRGTSMPIFISFPKKHVAIVMFISIALSHITTGQNLWQPTGLSEPVIRTLTITQPSGSLLAGTGTGIFRRVGQSWSPTSFTSVCYQVIVHPSTGILYARTGIGLHRSTDEGVTWTYLSGPAVGGTSNVLFFDAASEAIFLGGSSWLFRSTNSGSTWNRLFPSSTSGVLCGSSNAGSILIGTYSGVYRSTDNGLNWSSSNSGLSETIITTLFIDSDNSVFLGTDGPSGGSLYRSTNVGSNWTRMLITGGSIEAITKNSQSHIISASYSVGAYRSTNNGANWSLVSSGLGDLNVRSLAILPSGDVAISTSGGDVYIGLPRLAFSPSAINFGHVPVGQTAAQFLTIQNTGLSPLVVVNVQSNNAVFFSSITSATILPAEQRTPSITFAPILATPYNGSLSMSHNGIGPTSLTLSGTGIPSTSVALTSDVPSSMELEQNYPNPFNPTTTIEFALPKSGEVSLKIYNSIGQEVATLVDEEMTPGTYNTIWDATGMASGVYFYRLQASEFVQTKKLLLLR